MCKDDTDTANWFGLKEYDRELRIHTVASRSLPAGRPSDGAAAGVSRTLILGPPVAGRAMSR